MNSMNPLASLKEECQQLLWDALEIVNPGAELPESKYSYPPNPEMGDISSAVCFQLARSLKQRPADIAERMVEAIKV